MRTIVYPRGLPAAEFYFGQLGDRLGLRPVSYTYTDVFAVGHPISACLTRLLELNPDFLILPSTVGLDATAVRQLAGNVRAAGCPSTGTDHVDLTSARSLGLPYLYAPGMNAHSVVEYVAAALLGRERGRRVLDGEGTLGIIGYGRIGSRLGRLLAQLNVPHCFYDPFVDAPHRADWERVLAADCVSVHVPLTVDGDHPTRDFLNTKSCGPLRDGTLFINASRGPTMREMDLPELCRRTDSVLDVFPKEPPTPDMVRLPDLATPHIAGYAYEARAGAARALAEAYLTLLDSPVRLSQHPEPEYDHYVVDFLPAESQRLKQAPSRFMERRTLYPPRGDFRAYRRTHGARDPLFARVADALEEIK